tara:strand:+ start:9146 stop:9385 length:240 start_codon:yes stop_codon:yes gene_type:complete
MNTDLQTLQSIKEEYSQRYWDKRQRLIYEEVKKMYDIFPPNARIGSIAHEPITDDIFICNGTIKGAPTWARVHFVSPSI